MPDGAALDVEDVLPELKGAARIEVLVDLEEGHAVDEDRKDKVNPERPVLPEPHGEEHHGPAGEHHENHQ